MLAAGGLDLRHIVLRGELAAGDADDPAALGHLLVALAPVERRHQLADAEIAGGAEDDEVEDGDGDDLGGHGGASQEAARPRARWGKAGIAPRWRVVSAPTALAKRQMAVQARGVGRARRGRPGGRAIRPAMKPSPAPVVSTAATLQVGDVALARSAVNQVEPALPRLSVTSRRPSCQRLAHGRRVAAAGQELELVVAELDHLRLGQAGQDPGAGPLSASGQSGRRRLTS